MAESRAHSFIEHMYLFVGVQKEAFPDGAQPSWGQHTAPLSGACGPGAAEPRHGALHEDHRVVQGQEETVGKETGQYLECREQVLTRHSHVVSPGELVQTAPCRGSQPDPHSACFAPDWVQTRRRATRCVWRCEWSAQQLLLLFQPGRTLCFLLRFLRHSVPSFLSSLPGLYMFAPSP